MKRHRDALRQAVVLASAVLGIAGSFVGSGAAGGTPVQDAAGGALAADATLLAPAVPAFSIWTPIYLGLVAYAVFQLRPARKTDARARRLGYPVALSLLLNAAWILCVQFDLLAWTVPVIVLLLAVLAWAFRITLGMRPVGPVDAIVTDGTIGLYLGWVCVATAANVAAVLVAAGFDGFGASAEAWAIGAIALLGAVGVLLAIYGDGRLAPAASLAWGLAWIAVARLSGEPHSVPVGAWAIAAAVVVVAATVTRRIRAVRNRAVRNPAGRSHVAKPGRNAT